jgi:hypothetical protein
MGTGVGAIAFGVSLCLAWGAKGRAAKGAVVGAGLAVWLFVISVFYTDRSYYRRAFEGSTAGALFTIRSELSIYQADHGKLPASLAELTAASRSLKKIPPAQTPDYHPDSAAVKAGSVPDDSGGWLYDAASSDSARSLLVNCTHTDWHGTRWADY